MHFEDLIPEYLNQTLDQERRAKFEDAMANDAELKAKVEQEEVWVQTMRKDVGERPQMSFASFEPRIATSTWREWWRMNWTKGPVAAGAIAAVLIAFVIVPGLENTDEQTFETLSTPLPMYSHDVVRIVVHKSADIPTLAKEYQLIVVKQYPAASTVDVNATEFEGDRLRVLQSDPRVRLIQKIEGQSR